MVSVSSRTPLVDSTWRVRPRNGRALLTPMSGILLLGAAACLLFVAEIHMDKEPNWISLSSETVAVDAEKEPDASSETDPKGIKDTEASDPFAGISNFVKNLAQGTPEAEPLENAPPVKVELYMEALCPGCQYFTSHVLYPVLKEPGMADIIDLRIIPAGNAEIKRDALTKEPIVSCQHGETECEGNKILSCLQKEHHDEQIFMPAVDCLETHLPAKLSSSFFGVANATMGLRIIRNNAEVCMKQQGLDMDKILKCSDSEGDMLLKASIAETAALEPKFEYAPWVVVNGAALKDDAYSLKERVCQAYLGVKPEECDASKLKDYFPNQVLNGVSEAVHAMSGKASRQALNQYFDTLSAQQQKQHRLAEAAATTESGGRAKAHEERSVKRGLNRQHAKGHMEGEATQALRALSGRAQEFAYCDKSGDKMMA